MRRVPATLAILGLLLVIAAGVWKLVAPSQLVKYKTDVDKTPHEVGQLTIYVNPATIAPLTTPLVEPVDVQAHLHVVDHSASTVVVDVNQVQKIGALPPVTADLRYVFNRRSMKNVADPRAYAYQPTTAVDRSPDYAVIFPLHTGNGPYPVWKDETGTAFAARRVPTGTTTVAGTKLITMRGTLTDVPARAYYISTLSAQGIPPSLTLPQLTPQLRAQNVDPAQIERTVGPRLAAADRTAITALLAQPVNLRYLITATTTWLVEPTTGVITSIGVDQTMSVQPDITGIGRVQTILSQPRYAADPVVQAGYTTLARLVANPPTSRVLRAAYTQTPASVADITRYAHSLARQQRTVERTIPLALLIAGLVLAVGGGSWRYRREHSRGRGDDGGGYAPSTSRGEGRRGGRTGARHANSGDGPGRHR